MTPTSLAYYGEVALNPCIPNTTNIWVEGFSLHLIALLEK